MTTPRWRLILNGKSAGNEELRDAVGHWRGQGVQLEVRVTWEDGDAERYVAEAIHHGVDVIVAAGGDGTLSAVAETLAHREEPAEALPSLALIPMGTANDFATSAGIPTEPGDALALIGQVPARPIDLLRVDAGLKKMLGGLAYVITGIAKLGRIEPIAARLSGPDFAWEGDFIALGIGNGRQAGGGQQLCPQALIDDGLLDVTVLPELEGEVTATLGQMLKSGTQAALEQLATRARLPWLQVESERPLTLNLDGEPVQARHFRVECVPGRVRMHLPVGCPLLDGQG
jgi:diacylglycerol kinase family enzyme